jgi:SAM-dependent methyltransferase
MSRFIARQLRKPSGIFGRTIIARRLRRLNVSINRATLAALSLELDDRVLEVGFGPGDLLGAMTPQVPEGSVSGVDFSPDMVALCERRFKRVIRAGRLDLKCADVADLPFADGCFTKACTVNTIYFWPDPADALRELHRVLADGGRLVVAFSPRETMQDVAVARHGFTLHDAEQVAAMMRDAGYRSVRMVPGVGPRGEFICAVAAKLQVPQSDAKTARALLDVPPAGIGRRPKEARWPGSCGEV